MRDKFSGYYTPTKKEFSKLWAECIFIFDTNTLLNLYRYTEETYESFLNVLKALSDRIWIPYKVADEFQKNRVSCISDQEAAYTSMVKAYNKVSNDFAAQLNKYKQHKMINIKDYKKRLENFTSKEISKIKKVQKKHPNYIKNDIVLDAVSKMFKSKVGEKYNKNYLDDLYDKGKVRYDKKVPPGYMDVDKSDSYRTYGDLIIWYDIIQKAKTKEKPVIFVTSDNKEDWWFEHAGEVLGPRPELIQEFKQESDQQLYIYNPSRFIKYASKLLNQSTNDNILKEIENVRKSQLIDDETKYKKPWSNEDRLKFHNKYAHIEPDSNDNNNDTLSELSRRIGLYEEERSLLKRNIEQIQTVIRSTRKLVAHGVSDEDQEVLERKIEERGSQLDNLRYELHTVDENTRRIRKRMRAIEQEYSIAMRRQQEDLPF